MLDEDEMEKLIQESRWRSEGEDKPVRPCHQCGKCVLECRPPAMSGGGDCCNDCYHPFPGEVEADLEMISERMGIDLTKEMLEALLKEKDVNE